MTETNIPEGGGRKIFIASSTADLIDVRAELGVYLHELGLMPIMWEHKFEDDAEDPGRVRNRCARNVRGADAVVVVVSDRYITPPPKDSATRGRSATPPFRLSYTHFEYLEARRDSISVHFYARKFLLDRYAVWAHNTKVNGIRKELHDAIGAYAKSKNHRVPVKTRQRVQKALEEVSRSVKTPLKTSLGSEIDAFQLGGLYGLLLSQDCWPENDAGLITPFESVVDLKEHLRNDLGANRLLANYEDLLREGKLPFIRVAAARSQGQHSTGRDVYLKLANIAPTPAAFDSICGVYITNVDETRPLSLARDSQNIILHQPQKNGRKDEEEVKPPKVKGIDWSPLEPTVLRDGDEWVIRVTPQRSRISGDEGFTAWVVYQSVLGESLHVADRYEIRLNDRNRTNMRVFYKGKHVILPETQRAKKQSHT